MIPYTGFLGFSAYSLSNGQAQSATIELIISSKKSKIPIDDPSPKERFRLTKINLLKSILVLVIRVLMESEKHKYGFYQP